MKPNPQQQQVIDHFAGPCLVTAVPGAGKTASVTERIKKLVEKGVDPRSILAITFTNKAAAEMKSRVAQAVGRDLADRMTICTFHSLCARIIRHNAMRLGLSDNYTIYDTDDQERLLKTCIAKVEGEEFKPGREYIKCVMGYLEEKRNSCLTEQVAAERNGLEGKMFQVANEYLAQLVKSNALDFTGLLSETLRLFVESPEVRDRYRSRFQYISVDEMQDTNVAQYEIIKQLGMGHKNVVVVGDYDQSIYAFRGAFPENIMMFEKDFGAHMLKLETNYRSTPSILQHSQQLIERNTVRKPTQLRTDNSDGPKPRIVAGDTDEQMAALIADEARSKIAQGIRPSEIAVFYRVNSASRVLENAMRDRGVRYVVVGGLSFWHRKEIKIGLAFLKLLANGHDRMSFEKVCESCCKGAGGVTFHAISEEQQKSGGSMIEAARKVVAVSKRADKALTPLLKAWEGITPLSPGQALLHVSQATHFWPWLQTESTATDDRCENIVEMAADVDKYCSRQNSTLAGYLQTISLLTAEDAADEKETVKLMTLHACKGLEFDAVMISHCTSDLLPHARGVSEAADEDALKKVVEEERRLLYVGMTRARKHLALYFMRNKIDLKTKRYRPMFPSKFLRETGIPTTSLYNEASTFDE